MYQYFIPFLLANNVLLYEYITFPLFIFWFMNIWVVSTFLVIMNYAMNICVEICFLLGGRSIYLRGVLLGHMVAVC